VQVQKDGSIRLLDQGDYMRDLSSDIDEAIKQATEHLREQWPNIYSMWFGGSEQ
jgi:spermidine/putrescine-binding protein